MTQYYEPDRPTVAEGPFVDVDITTITEGEYHIIKPGYEDNVPQIYAVESIYANVQCSAVVANRNWRILTRNPDNRPMLYVKTNAITAGQNLQGFLGPLNYLGGLAINADEWYHGVEKDGIILSGLDSLWLFLDGAQTGDVSDAFVRLRYLNRELGMPTPYNKGGPWPQ